jgi:hypothetical protein
VKGRSSPKDRKQWRRGRHTPEHTSVRTPVGKGGAEQHCSRSSQGKGKERTAMTQVEPTIEQKQRYREEVPAAGEYAPIKGEEPMRHEKRGAHRRKTLQRANQTGAEKRTFGSVPRTATEEKEKENQTGVEAWGWKVQEGALQEAARRGGPPALGSIEVQLKRVSEQVTQQAQEKYKRTADTRKESVS